MHERASIKIYEDLDTRDLAVYLIVVEHKKNIKLSSYVNKIPNS